MYELILYQTEAGNCPLKKYLAKLFEDHKEDDLIKIKKYTAELKEHGPRINDEFKANAIKKLRNGIYELRPSSTRIFFFYFENNKIILLHAYEKKQNKTDNKEIELAETEMNIYKRRLKK